MQALVSVTMLAALQKRFVLGEALDGRPAVRAAQGHSVALECPVLEPVTSAEQLPGPAVHVTSTDGWAAIQVSAGLGVVVT